jgi:hypothetical protein
MKGRGGIGVRCEKYAKVEEIGMEMRETEEHTSLQTPNKIWLFSLHESSPLSSL